jgi:hypothetical protein
MRCRAKHVDPPGCQLDDEQCAIRHEIMRGPDLAREEVGGHNGRSVRLQDGLPRLQSFRNRRHAGAAQNLGDCAPYNPMAQIAERALQTRVAHVGFSRAIRNTSADVPLHAQPTDASPCRLHLRATSLVTPRRAGSHRLSSGRREDAGEAS